MIRNRVRFNRENPTRPDVITNTHTAHCEPPATDEPHHTIERTNSHNAAEVSALVSLIPVVR